MPIETAVYSNDTDTWTVFWTAPGEAPSTTSELIATFYANQPSPGAEVDFDASGSGTLDDSTEIVYYDWDFGDGSRVTRTTVPITSYSYPSAGTYSVTLTVTDDAGSTAMVEQSVPATVDILPVAAFYLSVSGLVVSVDASASTDPDGSVVSYDWDFGDGATFNGLTANHTYSFGGSYSVVLTVTDNQGAITVSSQDVTAAPIPAAAFVFTTNQRTVNVDASGTDDFNPIKSYTWSWGVAGSVDSTGVRQSHTYAADGTYPVTLTIKDVAGNEDFVTHEVSVALIKAPDPPVVRFDWTATNLKASFNASKSTVDDSTITEYLWDFGDGHTGSGITISHTYSDGGSYAVQLTCVDHLGARGTQTRTVTVAPAYVPPPPPPGPPPPPPPPPGHEVTSWAYQDMNRRQVVADDDYDPDESWQHHLDRGSLGGVDHNAPYGTPLHANSSGRVYTTSLANGGSGGRTLTIYTGSTGWYDQFMHLSSFAVSDGQYVKQGQLVGYSGASGFGVDYGYAPHFHLHRYTPGGTRVNSWHYFCGDGHHDSRNDKPGPIIWTLSTGVPNTAFYRRLMWYASLNGYNYPCDGYMSIPAWKGVQRGLRHYGYTGAIDGLPGHYTYLALQEMAHQYGSTSARDGSLSTTDYRAISTRLNLL